MYQVRFQNPNKRLDGEKRSKLIAVDSDLYRWLSETRKSIDEKYPNRMSKQRMDFHIEFIHDRDTYTEELLLSRCQAVEGFSFIPKLGIMKKAVVVYLKMEKYKSLHITVGYFPITPIPTELINPHIPSLSTASL